MASVTLQRKPSSRTVVIFFLTPLPPVQTCPFVAALLENPRRKSSEVKFLSLYALLASSLLSRLLFFLTVSHITLSFTHFGLESSTACTEDFLEILDGNYDDAPLRGTVAGALSSPPVASPGFYLCSCICVCCYSQLECLLGGSINQVKIIRG